MAELSQHQVELRNRFYSLLQEQQLVNLATAEGLQPRVRPVTMIRVDGHLFVISVAGDAKIDQIQANPRTEFSLLLRRENTYENIRVECTAELRADINMKSDLYTRIPWVKDYFSSPVDPRFILVELRPTWLYYKEPGIRAPTKISLVST